MRMQWIPGLLSPPPLEGLGTRLEVDQTLPPLVNGLARETMPAVKSAQYTGVFRRVLSAFLCSVVRMRKMASIKAKIQF